MPPVFQSLQNLAMEAQSIEVVFTELARDREMDVFHADGRLNHNALARELTRLSGGKTVQQSVVTRLIQGKLKGKLETLQPIAAGFGISAHDLLGRIRPESTSTPVPNLPPEAAELWALWSQLPRQLRNFFTEQMKNAIETKNRYPELSAAVSGEALQAANATRIQRQRKIKSR